MIKTTIKILVVNLFVVFSSLLLIEILFGYWFDKDNFGPYMREHRMKNQRIEFTHNGTKEIYFYRRNYYGFRGKDIEPSEIKAVILGGSVVQQRYHPEKYTITGFLNSNLKNDNIEITNGGVEAQSTRGMIVGFEKWLFKLKDFSPKIIVLYIGVNDHNMSDEDTVDKMVADGHILNPEIGEQLKDNIRSRSILYDTARILKFRYLPRKGFMKYDGNQDLQVRENFNYKDYNTALNEYDLDYLKLIYKKRIKNYLDRVDRLHKLSKKLNSNPIFITNISAQGYEEKSLMLNTSLIEHCKKKIINV